LNAPLDFWVMYDNRFSIKGAFLGQAKSERSERESENSIELTY
jgi:hypothetical protein